MLQSVLEVDSFVPIRMKKMDPPESLVFLRLLFMGNVFTQNTRSMVQFAMNAHIKVTMFVYEKT